MKILKFKTIPGIGQQMDMDMRFLRLSKASAHAHHESVGSAAKEVK